MHTGKLFHMTITGQNTAKSISLNFHDETGARLFAENVDAQEHETSYEVSGPNRKNKELATVETSSFTKARHTSKDEIGSVLIKQWLHRLLKALHLLYHLQTLVTCKSNYKLKRFTKPRSAINQIGNSEPQTACRSTPSAQVTGWF